MRNAGSLLKGRMSRYRYYYQNANLDTERVVRAYSIARPPWKGRLTVLFMVAFFPPLINVSPCSKSIMGVINGSKIFVVQQLMVSTMGVNESGNFSLPKSMFFN